MSDVIPKNDIRLTPQQLAPVIKTLTIPPNIHAIPLGRSSMPRTPK